jgi:flagellar assembly protein FliH
MPPMLAKVIRRPAEPFAPIEWPAAGPRPEASPAAASTEGQPPELAQLHAEIASLNTQLQSARADSERLVQEALVSGRRDGDESARQLFEKQLESELSKLRQMIRDLAASGPKLRRETEEDLVRLSVAIARRILHRELTIDPEALSGLVKAAFDRLDQREIHQLRTDPHSLTTVRKLVEGLDLPRAVKVIADPSLRSGSLLIETTRGQLDASMETQLDEIQRGFIDIVHHS